VGGFGVDEHLPKNKKINVWVGGFGVDEHLPKNKKTEMCVARFGFLKVLKHRQIVCLRTRDRTTSLFYTVFYYSNRGGDLTKSI
jgi:hypothetical protein